GACRKNECPSRSAVSDWCSVLSAGFAGATCFEGRFGREAQPPSELRSGGARSRSNVDRQSSQAMSFKKMKRGAYFINIARGACVVTEDLIDALRSGQLAGAGLDVVAPEPLPPDNLLWAIPNVLITPHVAIAGAPYRQRWEEILLENCRRFARNEPLLDVVDK